MAKEIERKFLVKGVAWRNLAEGVLIRQGYLCSDDLREVRVRVQNNDAWITVKSKASGSVRSEFEYEIPLADATAMLDTLCRKPLIEKRRHKIDIDGLVWEVDEFTGANTGLILAEVELTSPDQEFTKPEWIGEDVTDDPRFYNASLSIHPHLSW